MSESDAVKLSKKLQDVVSVLCDYDYLEELQQQSIRPDVMPGLKNTLRKYEREIEAKVFQLDVAERRFVYRYRLVCNRRGYELDKAEFVTCIIEIRNWFSHHTEHNPEDAIWLDKFRKEHGWLELTSSHESFIEPERLRRLIECLRTDLVIPFWKPEV